MNPDESWSPDYVCPNCERVSYESGGCDYCGEAEVEER